MVIPLAVSNKEWTLKVEEYEEIVLVAASENLVCFATANYFIRICSIFGTQRGIVSVPGPLVSMAAFKNVLLVAYHAGGVRNTDQCINIKLFKFEGKYKMFKYIEIEKKTENKMVHNKKYMLHC